MPRIFPPPLDGQPLILSGQLCYTVAMSQSPSPSRTRKRILSLKWEIILILIAKVVLLYAIWALWFDQPMPREHRAENVSRVILNK
jgi:hypothetical protein